MSVRIHCGFLSNLAMRSIACPPICLILPMQDAVRYGSLLLDYGAGTEKLFPFSTTQVARTVAPCGPALLM